MRSGMLDQLWTSIADAGRELVRTRLYGRRRPPIRDLCRDLLSTKGEASGAALARELVEAYRAMSEPERLAFFSHAGRGLRCRPGADPGRRRGLPRPAHARPRSRRCAAPARRRATSCSGG